MSLEKIKALAYDEGRKLEVARQNLQVLNKRIIELEKLPVKKEEPCNQNEEKPA